MRAVGAGAAGMAGAAMMGSGVATAGKPPGPDGKYWVYGALPDNIQELSMVSEMEEFLDLIVSKGGPRLMYREGGLMASLVPAVSDGTIPFGKAIINTHGIDPLKMMSELYWGMPFGMEIPDFVEWLYNPVEGYFIGEGMDLFNAMFAEQGVDAFAIPLYLTPGEGGAWHTKLLPTTAAEFATWGIPDGEEWGYVQKNPDPEDADSTKYWLYSYAPDDPIFDETGNPVEDHQYNIRLFSFPSWLPFW
jgi:hypothetical protein